MREVLDYIGIPTGCEQTGIYDFEVDEGQSNLDMEAET